MLNNVPRNRAYQRAITNWVLKNEQGTALDIGTGTGLLSIYIEQAGLKRVAACEKDRTMIEIAANVFNDNNMNIKLIPKHSKDLVVGRNIPCKFDLVVTEILDSGVIGENILQTLIHAKTNLMKDNARIIPWKVRLFVSGFRSRMLTRNYVLINETFKDSIYLKGHNLIRRRTEPYDAESIDKISDFKHLTTVNDEIEIDFNDLEQMKQCLSGEFTKKIRVMTDLDEEEERMDGFYVFFELFMDPDDPTNTICTEQGNRSCWNQAIFPLNQPVYVTRYKMMNLTVSFKDGILELKHSLNTKTPCIEIDEKILKFINDADYLREMENAISDTLKRLQVLENVADFSPFPYIGFVLMKERCVHNLYCKKENEDMIRMFANFNCIDVSKIHFVESPLELLQFEEKRYFEVIAFSPFDSLGDMDNQIICELALLRPIMKPFGALVPHKVEIYANLIHSEWLYEACRITNRELVDLKIADYMNRFATEIHLDLKYFKYKCTELSNVFKLADLEFTEDYRENTVSVALKNNYWNLHGLLCYYKIQFAKRSKVFVTTDDRYSHIGSFAFILNKSMKIPEESYINVNFKQNYGIIKCTIEEIKKE